jgi:hypothetical protein
VQGRVYSLAVGGPRLAADAPEIHKFLDSFEVEALAPPQTPPPATDFPGLLGYWPFDEADGEKVGDASGGGNVGKAVNAGRVPGVRGNALQFAGPGSHFDFGNSDRFSIPTGGRFTISGWLKTTADDGTVVSLRNSKDGAPVLDLLLKRGCLCAQLRPDGDEFLPPIEVVGDFVFVNDDAWHHFAVVRDERGELHLAVDGGPSQWGTSANSWKAVTTDLRAAGAELFWTRIRRGPGTPSLAGAVDELAIFDRELESEEIRRLAGRP